MTITIATSKLIDTLKDSLQTAGTGVHLATHRGPWRDEPGDVDLLAATSSSGYVVGHTWIPIAGQVRQPSVWPVDAAETVLAICKSLARKGEEHTVDIEMVMADPPDDAKEGDHPGWTVTLSETPALFDSDTEFQFHAHAEDVFPLRTVRRIFAGDITLQRGDFEETPLTLWSATVLAPLVAVAKRRKMQLQFFRSSERSVQVVQIGDTWLGAAMPGTLLPGEHGDEPSIEAVLGGAEEALLDTLAEMKANGVTVTVDNPKGPVGQTISEAADLLRNGSGVFMGRVDPLEDGITITSVEGTTGEDLPGTVSTK